MNIEKIQLQENLQTIKLNCQVIILHKIVNYLVAKLPKEEIEVIKKINDDGIKEMEGRKDYIFTKKMLDGTFTEDDMEKFEEYCKMVKNKISLDNTKP